MKCVQMWLSVDPLAEITVSPYAYVWNDPVNFADPTGLMGERKGGTDPCDPPARRSFVRRAWDYLFGARVDHGYKSNVRLQVNNRLEVGIPTKISEEDYQNTSWDSGNTRYEQVTRNTLITRKIGANNESPQYRFILPQNFGGWSQDDTGSDGLIWKGCLSCHSDNGAFTYATHNSQEANAGKMASAVIQAVVMNKLFNPTTSAVVEIKSLEQIVGGSADVVGTIDSGWYTGNVLNAEIVALFRTPNTAKGDVMKKLINGLETMARQKGLNEVRIEFKMVINQRLATDPTWAREYGYMFNAYKEGPVGAQSTVVTWEKVLK